MAAGASRLLGTCRAFKFDRPPTSSSSPSTSSSIASPSDACKRSRGEEGEKKLKGISTLILSTSSQLQQANRSGAAAAASSVTQLGTTTATVVNIYYRWRSLRPEMLIDKGIIGCRSFTLIAVAGSLVGSILCFVEGCFLVLESFFHFFHALSQKVDQGRILRLLIEAIDMFVVGTALLTFGMGLYVMFAAPNKAKQQNKGCHAINVATSNIFGLFNLQRLSDGMGMHSIAQAKSKIGHAVVLMLQTGLMEKLQTVSLATSFDLACFAGAVLISSASVFLLSKLTVAVPQIKHAHV